MSTSANKDIRAALSTKLLTIQVSDLPPIAFENESYEPETDEIYLREYFMPAVKSQVGIEDASADDYEGIYQVTVKGPSHNLIKRFSMESQAAAVENLFPRGTTLTHETQSVRVTMSEQHQGFTDDQGVYQIPVDIHWRAFK